MARFASVIARDVSASGAYLDSRGADAIPLYRLVYLQFERGVRDGAELPSPLRDGRVLSAIFRVGPCDPVNGHAVRVRPALSGWNPRDSPGHGHTADTHQRERAHLYAGSDPRWR